MRTLKAEKLGPNRFRVDMRGWMCPYPKYAVELLLAKNCRPAAPRKCW